MVPGTALITSSPPDVPSCCSKLTAYGSRAVIMLQFAVAAAVSLFMAVWRWTKLKESKVRDLPHLADYAHTRRGTYKVSIQRSHCSVNNGTSFSLGHALTQSPILINKVCVVHCCHAGVAGGAARRHRHNGQR